MFQCSICNGRTFKTREAYKSHLEGKMIHKPHQCPQACGYGGKTMSKVIAHCEKKHPSLIRRCPVCAVTFISDGDLAAHTLAAHKLDAPKLAAHPLVSCPRCNEIFADNNVMIQHHALKHPHFYCGICVCRIYECDRQKHLESPKHKLCSNCDLSFETTDLYRQHLSSPHDELFCTICSIFFHTKELLESHKESTPYHYRCTICNIRFTADWSLAIHNQLRHSNPMGATVVWGSQPVQDSSYESHSSIAAVVPFKWSGKRDTHPCYVCRVEFPKSEKKNHYAQYPDVHPACDICLVNYQDQTALQQHRMIKHPEPHQMTWGQSGHFACDICVGSSLFRDRFSLEQHKLIRHSEQSTTEASPSGSGADTIQSAISAVSFKSTGGADAYTKRPSSTLLFGQLEDTRNRMLEIQTAQTESAVEPVVPEPGEVTIQDATASSVPLEPDVRQPTNGVPYEVVEYLDEESDSVQDGSVVPDVQPVVDVSPSSPSLSSVSWNTSVSQLSRSSVRRSETPPDLPAESWLDDNDSPLDADDDTVSFESLPTADDVPTTAATGVASPGHSVLSAGAHLSSQAGADANHNQSMEVSQSPPSDSPSVVILRCGLCKKSPSDALVTMCGHIFCDKCVMAEVSRTLQCPTCKRPLFIRLDFPTV